VRDEVLKVTHNQQEPFIYGSLGGNDVPLVPQPPAPYVDPDTAARHDYELAFGVDMVATWDAFIRKYPTGFYSDLATAQRERLVAARAAEDARVEAARKASDEATKAAMAREADERQKALAEAEAARRMAANKLAEEVAAAEAERPGIAVQVIEGAKAADVARDDTAEAKVDSPVKFAALLPGHPAPGQEPHADANTSEHTDCADVSPQLASLSPDTARARSISEECALTPKRSFKECQDCPEMVVVSAGEFLMGSSKDEIDQGLAAANEAPQHKVMLGQTIAVGRFEVTRDQYAAFVGATGHAGSGRCFTLEQNSPQERENRSFLMPGYAQQGNHPAVCVSWWDAQAYVDWLTRITGKSYRLASEAEYEYAARAGSTARFGPSDNPTKLCRFANGADQSARAAGLPDDADYMACTDGYPYTAPVGSFAQNAFGLNDLIGNVWEWTADCFADDYSAAPADGAARTEAGCSARAVRGGDWFSGAALLRPAVRATANPDSHYDDIGFRVVRTLAH
jgi:formylglycine-generating enzyme required for sulfatase activity